MIEHENGHWRSIRTPQEKTGLLEKDLETLTPEERTTIELIMAELANPADSAGLLQTIGNLEWVRTPVDMQTFVMDPFYLGNTCDNLYPRLMEDLTTLFDEGYREAIFTGAIGWGKCVHPDTEVYDVSAGRRRRAGDAGDFKVASVREGREVVAEQASAFPSGVKSCVKLTLRGGQWIILSTDHPVLTGRGWVEAQDLTLDDLVAIPRSLPEPEQGPDLPDDEVALTALLMADGGCTNLTTFTNASVRIMAEFVRLVEGFNGEVNPTKSQNAGKATTVSARGIRDLVKRHGLDCKATEKRVPAGFYGLPRDQIRLFLNRFWACDGSVYVKAPSKVEVGLASEGLIDDLRFLLLRLGIHSRKYPKPTSYVAEDGERRHFDSWKLTITGREDILRFLDEVGDILSKEEACCALRDAVQGSKGNTNVDVVPVRGEDIGKVALTIGRPVPRKYKRPDRQRYSRETWRRLCEELDYHGPMRWFAEADLRWERVKAIEEDEEREVCDLSVPATTCFVGNGIVVHNTFAASIGICRLLYILSCMRDPHRSFGIAANSNISIVCLSVNEILATKVAYENIATKIEASPYFQENFPFEKTKKELRFPRKVWVAARASNDGSVLGLNVIGGLLDECVPVGSLILLGDGEQAKVETLVGRTDVVVETFDFELGHAVPAQAFVKWSSEQPCYELELDNGMVVRGSADHPVAVRQDDGTFTFNVIGAILDGQEVVVHAPMDGGAPESSFGEDEGPVGGGPVRGPGNVARGPREAGFSSQEDARGGERVRPASDGGGRQPDVWDAALRLAERAHRRSEQRSAVVRGGPQAHVRAACREAGSLAGVQGRVVRAQPSAQGQVQAHRGDQAEDLRVEHLETPQGGLSLSGLGGDDQGGARWLPQPVRIESHRVVGGGLLCDSVRVREAGGLLLVEREDPPHGAGLPGLGRRGSRDRSQAVGIHAQLEGEGQDGGRAELLREARLGVRSLGRELSVARVVSKRDVGVQPTYDVSVPGYECFVVDGALVHNTNFMPKATKGQDPRFNLQDRAEVLYNAMQRRMKSRFERKGRLPGILFVVSSKQTNDDFTAKRIKESAKDPTVFVRDYALWDVKPDIYYSGDWFHVVVGNEQAPSRIIETDEDLDEVRVTLPEDCVIIAVPEDFRGDFENDLEGAIRDLAGVATVSVSPYIQRRTKIIDAIRKDMRHPFSVQVYDPSQPGRFYWHKMLRPADDAEGGMRPIVSPYAPRHIHIDPSLSGDCTGFAMGHIAGWREVVRRDDEGNKYPERAPEIVFDLLLKIVPPIGGEIVLGEVRKLVYQLSKHGYMITCVSIDSWNSADAIQKLNQRGFNAIQLSVDRTMGPYDLLKTGLYEDRIYYYEYEPLLQELRELEHDRLKRKVDHPIRGSKDVADAAAGVVWTLTENSSALPLSILRSVREDGDAWMLEHQQASLARSYGSEDVSDMSEDFTGLPPFLVGSGGGWGD